MALIDTSLFDTRLFDDTTSTPGTPGNWTAVITATGNWTAAVDLNALLESAPPVATR